MNKKANDLVEYLRNGEWIDNMTGEENKLLADFLNQSMAKQRKKIAFAEKVKDGIIYVVYRVRERKDNKVLELVIPGDIYIHEDKEEVPHEVTNVPRIAFSTLFCLGEILNDDE